MTTDDFDQPALPGLGSLFHDTGIHARRPATGPSADHPGVAHAGEHDDVDDAVRDLHRHRDGHRDHHRDDARHDADDPDAPHGLHQDLDDVDAYPSQMPSFPGDDIRPINWNDLPATDARAAWRDLDAWVSWLRSAFGLPPTIIPPLWHRHDELVWELSALHTHWRACYDLDAPPSAPIGWMRDFAETRNRLRDWVAACGTRLDRDRRTRHTIWPGEAPEPVVADEAITDRAADFAAFVNDDIAARHHNEAHQSSPGVNEEEVA